MFMKYHCGMLERSYTVLGMMSGTSCDGLDMALTRIFCEHGKWHFEILAAETIPYQTNQQSILKSLTEVSAAELMKLHAEWGSYFGGCAREFMNQHSKQAVDFIASHGHTVFHQPDRHWTFQMGSGAALAVAAQCPVVCDFRTTDVSYGGQGAPLVPIGDRLFFPDYDFCLNLGGFANISYELNKERLAFDVCPLNLPLNKLATRLDVEFDEDGRFARQGVVNEELLKRLNALAYYQVSPPKSLGIEWLNSQFYSIVKEYNIPVVDLLATVTEHCAMQISKCVAGWSGKVLVTGGGAFNQFLLERVKFHASNMEWVVPSADLVNFKEALIFALLGVLRWELQINALDTVTGASQSSTGGAVYYY
jgi:anhydro-N-acetylmuramic acid kinase